MNHEILTNELDENTKLLIEKMEEELSSKDNEIILKDKEIKELKNELAFLKGVISNRNRKIFGASSEQVDANQLSFFNEAEKFSDSKVEEPTLEEITYTKAKKSNYTGKKDNLANLERVVIEHKLKGDELTCKECGEKLTPMGVKSRREIIKYVPAKLIIEEHVTYNYACKACEKASGESKILYDYENTRSSSCPKNFLGDFKGFLQTDGYSGYNSVSGATRVYCSAHIRRYFHNIIVDLDKEALKNSRGIIGFNYCEQIYKLEKELRESYSSDGNYYDIRFKIRAEKLAPMLDNFIEYVENEIKDALPRSPLGKALEYAKKHLSGLKNVLLDGSLDVDNNAAERAIKSFVIGRKNFLFANTAKGATASSNLYSIVETAKANNLVVERYLVYLFDNLLKVDVKTVKTWRTSCLGLLRFLKI